MSKALDATLPTKLAGVVAYTGKGDSADQGKVTVGASASTDTVSEGQNNNATLEDTMSGTATPTNPITAAVTAATAPDTKAIASVVENVLKDRDNQNAMNQHITGLATDAAHAKATASAAQAEVTTLKATNTDLQGQITTLKAEATTNATKLTEAQTALATANTALAEANGKIAKAELDSATATRKQALASKGVTSGKLFDRALATKDNKLAMADEDFDAALDSVVAVTATGTPAGTGGGGPAPATPSTGTGGPSTGAPGAPAPTPGTPGTGTPAPAPSTPGTGGTTGANASQQQQASAAPQTPDLSGAATHERAVAALTAGHIQPTAAGRKKFAAIGVGAGNNGPNA